MTQQMTNLTVRGIAIPIAIIVMMVVMVQVVFMMMVTVNPDKRYNRGFVVAVYHLPRETWRHERADEHDKQQTQGQCRDNLHGRCEV